VCLSVCARKYGDGGCCKMGGEVVDVWWGGGEKRGGGGWGFGKGERGIKVAREKGVEKKIPFPPFFFFENGKESGKLVHVLWFRDVLRMSLAKQIIWMNGMVSFLYLGMM